MRSTVKTMTEHGAIPASIRASVGPCIAQKSYEVGDEFVGRFLDVDPANEHFFKDSRKPGHMMFDLPGYIAARLAQAGVRQVSLTGVDTYANENDYFSFRRTPTATNSITGDRYRRLLFFKYRNGRKIELRI